LCTPTTAVNKGASRPLAAKNETHASTYLWCQLVGRLGRQLGEGYRGVEYGSKPLKKCLLAELGSRDGWGGCKLRSSIVLVETVIPVRAAPWAVEREGSGGAEALLWPEPVEWDAARTNFTAWTSGDGRGLKDVGCARDVRGLGGLAASR